MDKEVYCVTHCVSQQFSWWHFSLCFLFSFFLKKFILLGGGCIAKAEGRYQQTGNEWYQDALCERHKEWTKHLKNDKLNSLSKTLSQE